MSKQMWLTQEILFQTTLFGKEYVWMKDVDGTIYLTRLIDGTPQFMV